MKKMVLVFVFGVGRLVLGSELPLGFSAPDMVKNEKITITWSEQKKGTVVVFLASTCPCCLGHEQRLKTLAQRFKDFKFVGVHSNKNENEQEAQNFFKKTNFPFVVLNDVNQSIANAFGALKTPHVFIVSPKGKIIFEGGVDESTLAVNAKKHYLEDALNQIEQGKSPNPNIVKTLGCAIKRIK